MEKNTDTGIVETTNPEIPHFLARKAKPGEEPKPGEVEVTVQTAEDTGAEDKPVTVH
jgi:hypothetical protein